jgi:hypothetical protein
MFPWNRFLIHPQCDIIRLRSEREEDDLFAIEGLVP